MKLTLTPTIMIRAAGAVVVVMMLVTAAAGLQFRVDDGEARDTDFAVWLPGDRDFGDQFTLVDHNGNSVTEADFIGNFMLVYFGYSFCPDICQDHLSNIIAAMDLLPDKGASIVPVFITIDPERDTVEILANYVDGFHSRLIGLTGAAEQIAAFARIYDVSYTRLKAADDANPDDYSMAHTNTAYLVGPGGWGQTSFSGASAPEIIAEGVEKFLAAHCLNGKNQ